MKLLLHLLLVCVTIPCYAQKFHDAALFNAANGNIRYIETLDGRISFTKDGKIDKANSPYLSTYNTYNVQYNTKGYPIQLTTDFDKTKFEYDDNNRIKKRVITGSTNMTLTYDYDNNLNKVKETKVVLEGGRPQKAETIYDVNTFDSRNNWIQRGVSGNAHTDTHVETTQIGLAVSGYKSQHVSTSTYYTDDSNELRLICYWGYDRFKNDANTDIDFIDAIKYPFLIKYARCNVKPKNLEKHLKYSKLKYEYKKGYSKSRDVTMSPSDTTCFGYPLIFHAGYYRDFDYLNEYDVTIVMDNKDKDDFFCYMLDVLKSKDLDYKLFLNGDVRDKNEKIIIKYPLLYEERVRRFHKNDFDSYIIVVKSESGIKLIYTKDDQASLRAQFK